MNYRRMFIFLLSVATMQSDDFIIEKKVEQTTHDKKYSELHDELLQMHEQVLRCQVQLLHDLADAQNSCMDALKKSAENMPKMSRERVVKEVKRLKTLCETLKSTHFF